MSIFSERTSTLMHQYGLNQKDLAKMAGVTESAMSYYIKGERTPRSDVLTRIAKALNTTTDYLLGITNTSAQSKNKEIYTQTMLMARHQKIAKLFDEDFWVTR